MKYFGVCLCALFACMLPYFCIFHNCLSTDSGDWGNFGSYLGAVSSLILSGSVFLYSYSIDKKQQQSKFEEQVYKLLMIVSESLTLLNNLHLNNRNLSTLSNWQRGTGDADGLENELSLLTIKILANYKATQILVKGLYGKTLPDKQQTNDLEEQFKKVYEYVDGSLKKGENDIEILNK